MRRGPTAVLRVNSAGILAKVGSPDLGDAAITALRGDDAARHLYLTALTSRVLDASWDDAAHLAASVNRRDDPPVTGPVSGRDACATERLTAELLNPRDAAARWCSAVLLATPPTTHHDTTRAALTTAVSREKCCENLRAYAAVLAGANP